MKKEANGRIAYARFTLQRKGVGAFSARSDWDGWSEGRGSA